MQISPDATKIKRWRNERCWSQEHLADLAGIGLRTIQRVENGESASRESLMALAAAFNVDVIDLTLDAKTEAEKAMKEERAKSSAALRLSFFIHLASYIFGMVIFTGISISDGVPGFVMMAPAIWWTVGLAGHGLVLVLVHLATHFETEAQDHY